MEQKLLTDLLKKYKKSSFNTSVIKDLLADEIKKCNKKIIVLDDDPTGVQTVHGVYVYTDWSLESIREGFTAPEKLFYLLTNSRGLTEAQTIKVHTEIAERILEVSKETGQEFLIISRGDSTLRGHYPLETEVLKDILNMSTGREIDGEILFPFFLEGGRFTAENIHYVNYGGTLIPAGGTEFAGDKTFGYHNSDLRRYIEEKSAGEYKAESVTAISLESLKSGDIEGITKQLERISNFNKVIVNALDYQDVEVFCLALYIAINRGRNFLFRSAASFVKIMGGISDRPLLKKAEMIEKMDRNYTNGGLIVAGSHTAKTTEQLNGLRNRKDIAFLEFDSDLVLIDKLEDEVERIITLAARKISAGITVVIYTKRKLLVLDNDTTEDALLRSVKISEALQSVVGRFPIRPAFVIAKGGITSSDIGVKALQVKRALVLGQAAQGIPVWKTDEESKFPGIPYIIFPGNVGNEDTLREVVDQLT
ncbi:four-carbon acid sugar kinase family protein [Anaerocolumna sp. AGMB13025]|uniref:four-carbon acid sugar kinase family protein n=1 Tax=Anaerocolumna sp. AGMB13025 TaxID=3039116 RepID=UPI00241C7EE2|nr:four-carbon acid sugar kinase family protein [Anaerocolumna sp. AGMB13025]WFR56357.1 four-carbon acid sugar kinase family protein [Anaerocolumna sp. AGMB13025]